MYPRRRMGQGASAGHRVRGDLMGASGEERRCARTRRRRRRALVTSRVIGAGGIGRVHEALDAILEAGALEELRGDGRAPPSARASRPRPSSRATWSSRACAGRRASGCGRHARRRHGPRRLAGRRRRLQGRPGEVRPAASLCASATSRRARRSAPTTAPSAATTAMPEARRTSSSRARWTRRATRASPSARSGRRS